jgi:hypothetical protein
MNALKRAKIIMSMSSSKNVNHDKSMPQESKEVEPVIQDLSEEVIPHALILEEEKEEKKEEVELIAPVLTKSKKISKKVVDNQE